jgi:hypothetical protein
MEGITSNRSQIKGMAMLLLDERCFGKTLEMSFSFVWIQGRSLPLFNMLIAKRLHAFDKRFRATLQ